MTNFKEMANLLAKGMNFEENAAILATAIDNVENLDITVTYNGSDYNVREILKVAIENYLAVFDDEAARFERDILLNVFAKDEQRRMEGNNAK